MGREKQTSRKSLYTGTVSSKRAMILTANIAIDKTASASPGSASKNSRNLPHPGIAERPPRTV